MEIVIAAVAYALYVAAKQLWAAGMQVLAASLAFSALWSSPFPPS